MGKNQAIRYLLYVIHQLGSEDAAVHNTLLSIYASHPSRDEQLLLQYLETHTGNSQYDSDFALRLCIQHGHVQSCVHIYSSMGQFADAVQLALKHGNVELASIVADRPEDDPALRKKLWLSVAKRVIAQAETIKTYSPPSGAVSLHPSPSHIAQCHRVSEAMRAPENRGSDSVFP